MLSTYETYEPISNAIAGSSCLGLSDARPLMLELLCASVAMLILCKEKNLPKPLSVCLSVCLPVAQSQHDAASELFGIIVCSVLFCSVLLYSALL